MDVIVFNQRVKHGRLDFHPTIAYGFEDPDAAPYFTACGWASASTDEPAVTITLEELDIDPCTIFGDGANKGKFVMPDRAAAALSIGEDEAAAYVWNGEDLNARQAGVNANG
jgi:hypothetical protein